ncbi:recombinase family protein [Lentzea kentuckyensis]|jgi:DNA invertase Pin-like site-specific DNA recombinase|uniref:recombinase family protein n=1 Tax=Lentzea kentuckyensis TaxID=360086 RepID=UPI0013029BA1|nr:recombinase family protein [Lentzea kentuckyensis]
MGYTSSTAEPLPDNENGLRAVVLVPIQKDSGAKLEDGRAYKACVQLCRNSGYGIDRIIADEGPRTTFERPTMKTAMSLLTRTRPDVVVIYTWEQIGRQREHRYRFTQSMANLGISIHSVNNSSAPHLDWDSDDHTRQRGRIS